jgi:2-methylisocitrate lyase-like PEP mutase family enzyme
LKSKAKKLRDLIDSGEHFIAADAYSALTGKIVEMVGFQAAYLGGHACSAFHYAMPDYGVYSQVEQIEQASRIAEVINIPLIADADTLGETVADAFHFTRRYVRSEIAGFHVEDNRNPRHSSYQGDLVPVVEMQAKLEACVKARGDSEFVIIARCDELYPKDYMGAGNCDLEQAIARGKAYAEAGADVLNYPLASQEMCDTLVAELPIPVCVLGPVVPGTAFALHTGWGMIGAAKQHFAFARELMETGAVNFDHSFPEKNALLEMDMYNDLIREWASKTGRETR